MMDLEKALEHCGQHWELEDENEIEIFDAARRFANLTSPETIETVVASGVVPDWGWTVANRRMIVEAVLRAVEEGTK